MRITAVIAACALAIFVAACGSSSDPTTTPTTVAPTSGAVASGTPAPVDSAASFIAIVDLATGQQTTVFDGAGTWNTWFEPGGETINGLVIAEAVPPRAVRFAVDGRMLVDSTTELQLRTNADGSARAYAGEAGSPGLFQTFLEVDGTVVELEGDPTALPLSFSPAGDRLLSYSGVATADGQVAFSYHVHELDGTAGSTFTSQPAPGAGSSPATWSPSGAYVATLGIDGLTVHDIAGGGAFLVPVNGWTEWSPAEDALIVVASASELQVLRWPNLDTTELEVDTNGVAASFDPSGRVVVVTNILTQLTAVFDAVTGEQLVEWGGMAEGTPTIGFEPVIMTDDGLAAVLDSAPGCEGILVIHPSLGGRGQCLIGEHPRWAPDASAVTVTRGSEIVRFEIETLTELVVASGLPTTEGGTLARWNESGTHLLLEWPWGGGGWTDSLP